MRLEDVGPDSGAVGASGYRVVWVDGKMRSTHRVLWERAYGHIPAGMQIDHIDGDKLNNSLDNLRLATNAENQWNQGARAGNTSGFKGVSYMRHRQKFRATIRGGGKWRYLGSFDTAEAAAAAYREAATSFHGRFAHHLSQGNP